MGIGIKSQNLNSFVTVKGLKSIRLETGKNLNNNSLLSIFLTFIITKYFFH